MLHKPASLARQTHDTSHVMVNRARGLSDGTLIV